MFEGFKKGSGGRYVWDEETKQFLKTSDEVHDPNAGFNGPVWFPKGGTKYFDKALNKTFYSLQEKKDYMKANGLIMQGMNREGDTNAPEAGLGKRYTFIPGISKRPKYYKYR